MIISFWHAVAGTCEDNKSEQKENEICGRNVAQGKQRTTTDPSMVAELALLASSIAHSAGR